MKKPNLHSPSESVNVRSSSRRGVINSIGIFNELQSFTGIV